MSFLKIPGVERFIPRRPAPPPAVLTSYSILVQERADNQLAILLQVKRQARGSIETRQSFAITDELDPRLEQFLIKMARMENQRRRRVKRALNPEQPELSL